MCVIGAKSVRNMCVIIHLEGGGKLGQIGIRASPSAMARSPIFFAHLRVCV